MYPYPFYPYLPFAWALADDCFPPEFRTVTFGSLIEEGFDWGADAWTSALFKEGVLEEVRRTLNEKIEETFYYREISIEDPEHWRRLFIQKINKLVSKQAPVYNELAEGIDLSGQTDRKRRLTHSEFPQAQLANMTEDYASNADQEGEVTWSSDKNLEALQMWTEGIEAPDNAILEGLDEMFSHRAYFLHD